LKWADEEMDIRPPMPLRFRRLPYTRPVPIVLSIDEAMAFINAANNQCRHAAKCPGNPRCIYRVPYNVMFKTFFYLGLRKKAVLRMRWEDIDWAKHGVKTIEKGNKKKWHPLPDDLHKELRALYVNSSSAWVFPSPRNLKNPVSNILKGVKRAREAAGITKRVYPHLLRHSIATHMLDSDVDIRQIQAFLDHSHISTTEFYAQVSLEKKRQALEKAGIKTSKM
jgi:integrase